MNVIVLKICNESNRTKIAFNQKNNCSYLDVTDGAQFNQRNDE